MPAASAYITVNSAFCPRARAASNSACVRARPIAQYCEKIPWMGETSRPTQRTATARPRSDVSTGPCTVRRTVSVSSRSEPSASRTRSVSSRVSKGRTSPSRTYPPSRSTSANASQPLRVFTVCAQPSCSLKP